MTEQPIPPHGGQLRAIAQQFGVPEHSLLDFSASISPQSPPDALLDVLCASIRERSVITRYPDTNYTALKQAIAHYADIRPGSISVGNGGMALLLAAVRALRVRKCVVLVPAFLEYERVLASSGVERATLALSEENEFALDAERVLKEIKATRPDALLLANPHSPSGQLASAADILQLQQAVAALGVSTIVDEAFIDYAPEQSVSRHAEGNPKLIALRSLTKFFAMPGLRVGYAVTHLEKRPILEAAVPLWPVDSIAAEAATLALQDRAAIETTRERNRNERELLADQLRSIGLAVFPAAANYLLFRVGDKTDGIDLWRRMIAKHGIVMRSCANFEGLNERYFRVAVRLRAENQRLIAALSDSLSAE
jgi:threonine-phosphate decarboxylase